MRRRIIILVIAAVVVIAIMWARTEFRKRKGCTNTFWQALNKCKLADTKGVKITVVTPDGEEITVSDYGESTRSAEGKYLVNARFQQVIDESGYTAAELTFKVYGPKGALLHTGTIPQMTKPMVPAT